MTTLASAQAGRAPVAVPVWLALFMALLLSGCGVASPTNTPGSPISTGDQSPDSFREMPPTPTALDGISTGIGTLSGGGGGGGSQAGDGPPGSPFDGALTSDEQEAAYVAQLRGRIEGMPDGWWMRVDEDVYAYLGRTTEPGGPPGDWFVTIHDVVTHEGVNVTLDGTVIVSASVDLERRFDLAAIAGELADARE